MKRVYFILYCLFFTFTGYFAADTAVKYYKKMLTPKNHKFLVCISSFKRPIFLSGQILRFKNQTYQNFDISVSIKGVTKYYMQEILFKEWEDLFESKKLKVRFDSNKGQLSNLMDTVRDIDLNRYDYFCKVDDDDWYAPDYLENVNEWLNKSDKDISITASANNLTVRDSLELNRNENMALIIPNNNDWKGPTVCVSRKVIETMLELEKNSAALEPYFDRDYIESNSKQNEDKILDKVADFIGNRQIRQEETPKVIFGQQYPSVTRGGGYLR